MGAAAAATAIAEHVRELADERLEAREAEVGEEVWAQVERFVLLRTIDSLWVEHLTELDDMRRGIGLRGYAQQDPLNEFRREAFRLYEELRDLIRHGVASTIFRVTVQRQPPRRPGGRSRPGRSPATRARRRLAGRRERRRGRAERGGRSAPAAPRGRGLGVLRGGVPPARPRNVRDRPLGDAPVRERRRRPRERRWRRPAGGPARATRRGRPDRAQRPVLVRLGREVQEVPRP